MSLPIQSIGQQGPRVMKRGPLIGMIHAGDYHTVGPIDRQLLEMAYLHYLLQTRNLNQLPVLQAQEFFEVS